MVHAEATATTATATATTAEQTGVSRGVGSPEGPANPTHSSKTTEEMKDAWWELEFNIDMSRRYHQMRRGYYDSFNKFLLVIIIVCGSAAAAKFLNSPEILGGIAALAGAVNLAFGFSHKARDHELLYRRFTDLARRLYDFETPELARREQKDIERDEPPQIPLLVDFCHWETAIAFGCDPGIERPGPWARMTMHFLDFAKSRANAVPTATPRPTQETPSST